jgi:hypothetical protein
MCLLYYLVKIRPLREIVFTSMKSVTLSNLTIRFRHEWDVHSKIYQKRKRLFYLFVLIFLSFYHQPILYLDLILLVKIWEKCLIYFNQAARCVCVCILLLLTMLWQFYHFHIGQNVQYERQLLFVYICDLILKLELVFARKYKYKFYKWNKEFFYFTKKWKIFWH